MHFADWWFFGMHAFWWLFWIVLIVLSLSLFTPVPKQQARSRGTPLELLQRRMAAGEISTEEYERRRAILLRDGAKEQGMIIGRIRARPSARFIGGLGSP